MKKTVLFLLGVLSFSVRADPEKEAALLFERQPGFPATQEMAEKTLRDTPGVQDLQKSKDIQELTSLFEKNNDTGKREGDSIRSNLSVRVREQDKAAKDKDTAETSLSEVEGLLNKKRNFRLPKTDSVFYGHRAVQEDKSKSESAIIEQAKTKFGADFSQRSVSTHKEREDKIVTCREAGQGRIESCTRQLILTAVPQEPIIKTVTAYFSARCYNLVTFSMDLKTGTIQVSQCENPGPRTLSVSDPIGEPELPDQTRIELISARNLSDESGVIFNTSQMTPTVANGFIASFSAFQPHTGRKRSHERNKNTNRGGQYTWRVTLPRKPKLLARWEGCEDLERKQIFGACTLGESLAKGGSDSRRISGFSDLVKRDFWEEQRTYLCGFGSDKNECERLSKQGCEQIDSKCVLEKAGYCLEFEQTFRCRNFDFQGPEVLPIVEDSYFLTPKKQPGFEQYGLQDFGVALTQFNALKEMSNEMKDGLGGIGGDPSNPTIFHGKCERCTIKGGSFIQDCCNLKGILQGILGGGCRESEKLATAHLREKRCHLIERRYCSQRIKLGLANVCVEWKDAYCCYGSELARIIQEIAHDDPSQTALRAYNSAHGIDSGWGVGNSPNCQSLNAEQLSLINFDTAYAQQQLGQLVKEFEKQAESKFKAIDEKAQSPDGMEARAKRAEESLKRHFSIACPDRPKTPLRED